MCQVGASPNSTAVCLTRLRASSTLRSASGACMRFRHLTATGCLRRNLHLNHHVGLTRRFFQRAADNGTRSMCALVARKYAECVAHIGSPRTLRRRETREAAGDIPRDGAWSPTTLEVMWLYAPWSRRRTSFRYVRYAEQRTGTVLKRIQLKELEKMGPKMKGIGTQQSRARGDGRRLSVYSLSDREGSAAVACGRRLGPDGQDWLLELYAGTSCSP